ncbi:MAG TPA: hypothetical protein VER11_29890, partial [Polyangiaceae bacterium]|nr:hypothetical protein [Polyangiaceae bacterium]
AHSRLQQSPQPLHTVPSTPLQKVEPEGGAWQVPTEAPLAIVHCPEQQSGSFVQMSPVWMHQETANWQVPFEQVFEQHSEPVWH